MSAASSPFRRASLRTPSACSARSRSSSPRNVNTSASAALARCRPLSFWPSKRSPPPSPRNHRRKPCSSNRLPCHFWMRAAASSSSSAVRATPSSSRSWGSSENETAPRPRSSSACHLSRHSRSTASTSPACIAMAIIGRRPTGSLAPGVERVLRTQCTPARRPTRADYGQCRSRVGKRAVPKCHPRPARCRARAPPSRR